MTKIQKKKTKSRRHKSKKKQSVKAAKAEDRVSRQPSRLDAVGQYLDAGLERIARHRRWFELAALLIIMAIGLLVRLEPLPEWTARKDKAFYNGVPLLRTFDGNYYLTLARDLAEGTYEPINEKRAVPDSPPRPFPPPLLSVLATAAAKLTSYPLNWIAVLLPAFLGILVAVPLYLLGRFYGGSLMGLTAAFMGVLSHSYAARSNLGWFDTDCMNLTWITAATYCFLRFGVETTRRRYFYLLAGMAIYGLFLWWWDQAPTVVTAITLWPLAVAVLFFYRPPRRERWLFFGVVFIGFAALLLWQGPEFPVRTAKALWSKYSYVTKKVGGDFPAVGISVAEQRELSLREIVDFTTSNLVVFVLAMIGIGLLIWRRAKESLFLAVLLLLGVVGSFYAWRFAIFLAPVTGLGLGFLVSELWQLRRRYRPLPLVVPLLIVALAWPAYRRDVARQYWPRPHPEFIKRMEYVASVTPAEAVVWTGWDHGYHLIYWARRSTVSDGGAHGSQRTVYTGLPLVTDSYRLSANFMQFFVMRGVTGVKKFYQAVDNDRNRGLNLLKQILAAGPEEGRRILAETQPAAIGNWRTTDDWLEFFFPRNPRPVYLFLDGTMMNDAASWYWYSTWDIQAQQGQPSICRLFSEVTEEGETIRGSDGLQIDLKNGQLSMGNRGGLLTELVVRDHQDIDVITFDRDSPGTGAFVLFTPTNFGVLMGKGLSQSVFYKLFLRNTHDETYFRPVALNSPAFQVWQVRGDSLQSLAKTDDSTPDSFE